VPRSPARWAAVAALAALTAGCGPPPTGTVSGTVKVNGQPVANGTITFESEVGTRDVFSAAVIDGKYATDPIPVGPTKVSVVNRQPNPAAPPPKEGKLMAGQSGDLTAPARPAAAGGVPTKYNSSATSGLTYEVTKGENKKDFDLTP
jgi:hypothetical protein